MIRRLLTVIWSLSPLLFAPGCAYDQPISREMLGNVAPTPASAFNGTYADRSPSVFGGSIWKMLTGEYLDSSGVVQVQVQVLPRKKLEVIRLVNGVKTAHRIVPYHIEHGYVRVSRSRWWTLLLLSDTEWDESALSRDRDELMIYQDKGYVLFVTVLPLLPDTGPPPNWRRFPPAGTVADVQTKWVKP